MTPFVSWSVQIRNLRFVTCSVREVNYSCSCFSGKSDGQSVESRGKYSAFFILWTILQELEEMINTVMRTKKFMRISVQVTWRSSLGGSGWERERIITKDGIHGLTSSRFTHICIQTWIVTHNSCQRERETGRYERVGEGMKLKKKSWFEDNIRPVTLLGSWTFISLTPRVIIVSTERYQKYIQYTCSLWKE